MPSAITIILLLSRCYFLHLYGQWIFMKGIWHTSYHTSHLSPHLRHNSHHSHYFLHNTPQTSQYFPNFYHITPHIPTHFPTVSTLATMPRPPSRRTSPRHTMVIEKASLPSTTASPMSDADDDSHRTTTALPVDLSLPPLRSRTSMSLPRGI